MLLISLCINLRDSCIKDMEFLEMRKPTEEMWLPVVTRLAANAARDSLQSKNSVGASAGMKTLRAALATMRSGDIRPSLKTWSPLLQSALAASKGKPYCSVQINTSLLLRNI